MSQRRKRAAAPTKSAKARKASKPAKGRAEKRIVIKPAATKVEGPDEIEAIKLAMEMHKAGKTIGWVRKRMERILVDENNKPLDPSFLISQFEAFNYRYKSTEKHNLRRKPDRRLDKDLDSR